MSENSRGSGGDRGEGERSEPEPRAELRPAGTPGRTYTAEQKAAALREIASSGHGMRAWCARQGISMRKSSGR